MVIILSLLVGFLIGIFTSFFILIKPLQNEIENLKETLHQQTKIGFYHELKQDKYE